MLRRIETAVLWKTIRRPYVTLVSIYNPYYPFPFGLKTLLPN